jgi:hypothetical protein
MPELEINYLLFTVLLIKVRIWIRDKRPRSTTLIFESLFHGASIE